MTLTTQIKNNTFIMHPCGVLFWEEKATLLISDVHLGKVSHFRKFGAAVPQKAVAKNFKSLTESVDFFQPKVVCFMGDLFHSSLNKEWLLFEKWVSETDSKIVLVAGNHDIISPLKYEDLGIEVVSEIQKDDFLFTHHPEERTGFFNFSGHIHPAVRLRGGGRQTMRLSCFYKTTTQMILPAFGQFTGTYVLEPKENTEIFATTGEEVFQVTLTESKKRKRFSG